VEWWWDGCVQLVEVVMGAMPQTSRKNIVPAHPADRTGTAASKVSVCTLLLGYFRAVPLCPSSANSEAVVAATERHCGRRDTPHIQILPSTGSHRDEKRKSESGELSGIVACIVVPDRWMDTVDIVGKAKSSRGRDRGFDPIRLPPNPGVD
jgi:hypothetical protein